MESSCRLSLRGLEMPCLPSRLFSPTMQMKRGKGRDEASERATGGFPLGVLRLASSSGRHRCAWVLAWPVRTLPAWRPPTLVYRPSSAPTPSKQNFKGDLCKVAGTSRMTVDCLLRQVIVCTTGAWRRLFDSSLTGPEWTASSGVAQRGSSAARHTEARRGEARRRNDVCLAARRRKGSPAR